MHIVIDGMNVIGSRPDGWWHDRRAARRALVEELSHWSGRCRDGELTVVFDGTPDASEVDEAGGSGVAVVFAPGGPDAADDAIVELLQNLPEDRRPEVTVVTSDGALADHVRKLGARVQGAAAFRSSLERRGGGRADA